MSTADPRTIGEMCSAAARLLRTQEWSATNVDRVDGDAYACCPECCYAQDRGHAKDCDLNRTASELEAFARVESAIAAKGAR